MSRRHEPPRSVRPERTLTRAGLWATGPQQLQLPFEASGLSERIQATGRLKLTPDFDVFAWLCERWQTRPTDSGWMRPTLYEIGSALYDKAPSGENYRDLRDALDRLAAVQVTIDGYDVETGTFRDNWIAKDEKLVHLGRPKSTPTGLDRPSISLAEWLRDALADGAGTVVMESLEDRGEIADARDAATRGLLASGLAELVALARPLADLAGLRENPMIVRPGRVFPDPHDLRFDFGARGGEWIDAIATRVRPRRRGGRRPSGRPQRLARRARPRRVRATERGL
jgi:hypothetical protein